MQDEPVKHAVVFDVNIYLDIADLLGPPFTWVAFSAATAQHSNYPLPNRADGRVDSLRAVAVCQSGRFAASHPLAVWTSAHIDSLVRRKAAERLGWTYTEAQHLVDLLVHGIMTDSDGGTLGLMLPYGNPPLDHEDGMVYAACRDAMDADDVLVERFCVTRDPRFPPSRTAA